MEEQSHTNQLVRLLKHFNTAMFVSRDTDGSGLRARPMTVASVDPTGDLWFVTALDSGKTDEVLTDPNVLVVFQGLTRYAAVSGEAQIIWNAERSRDLWREQWRPWFPGGPNDPSLVVFHVKAKSAEFWDLAGMRGVHYVVDAFRNWWRGERLSDGPTDYHQRVNLRLPAHSYARNPEPPSDVASIARLVRM